jgi:hypothetical protein
VKKPYKTAIFSHQDLPDGGFLCLIPHFDPVSGYDEKMAQNLLVPASQQESTAVNH